jgi:tRNA dimethylallyltransferase
MAWRGRTSEAGETRREKAPELIMLIVGCTGSGKGAVARELTRRTNAEIISMDAMKVYRRMDIGTAKPSAQARAETPFHLLDVVEPSEEFSVARYVALADRAISEIRARNRPVLICGGTILYLKALIQGLFEGPGADPELRAGLHARAEQVGSAVLHQELRRIDPAAAERIHPNDLRRIVRALEVYELTGKPISALQSQWDRGRSRIQASLIGLRRSSEDQRRRTNARVDRMMEAGLVGEVRTLLAEPLPLSRTARQAVGYAEIIEYLGGETSLEQAIERIKINTRQFAKSQRTWFRRFREIDWVDATPDSTAEDLVPTILQRLESAWSRSPN